MYRVVYRFRRCRRTLIRETPKYRHSEKSLQGTGAAKNISCFRQAPVAPTALFNVWKKALFYKIVVYPIPQWGVHACSIGLLPWGFCGRIIPAFHSNNMSIFQKNGAVVEENAFVKKDTLFVLLA
jgi:hypothetical protein